MTFKITVNGQLLLAMLYEMISTRIPNAQPLMQNTDGLEFIVDECDEEEFFKICKEWEDMTKLELESDEYTKIVVGDVNSYVAVYKDGSTKCKGRFEFEELPLHKNKSALIVPKAIYAYFIDGVDPKVTLENNKNIFDYCIGSKIKGDWFFVEKWVEKGVYKEKILQKIIRHFISTKGTKLVKTHPDGRQIQLASGPSLHKVFNEYEDLKFEDYNVNMKYYLDKIYDEITKIESSSSVLPSSATAQLTLF